MLLLAITSTLSLTGCAISREVVTEFQTIFVSEPEELQHCAPEPVAPPKGARMGEWGAYILDLRSAGADCRDKVARGKAWNDQHRPKGDEK